MLLGDGRTLEHLHLLLDAGPAIVNGPAIDDGTYTWGRGRISAAAYTCCSVLLQLLLMLLLLLHSLLLRGLIVAVKICLHLSSSFVLLFLFSITALRLFRSVSRAENFSIFSFQAR